MGKRSLVSALTVIALLVWPLAALADNTTEGPFSRTEMIGGWSCPDGQKIDTGKAGTYYLEFGGYDGDVTIVVNSDKSITFTTNHESHVVDSVLVKGGPQALIWYFDPAVDSATVHAPVNPNNGKYYGVSHLCLMTDKK